MSDAEIKRYVHAAIVVAMRRVARESKQRDAVMPHHLIAVADEIAEEMKRDQWLVGEGGER